MKKEEFYQILKQELEVTTGNIDQETILRSIPGWDSMSTLVIITIADNHFGVKLNSQQLSSLKTVGDIIHLIGDQHFQ